MEGLHDNFFMIVIAWKIPGNEIRFKRIRLRDSLILITLNFHYAVVFHFRLSYLYFHEIKKLSNQIDIICYYIRRSVILFINSIIESKKSKSQWRAMMTMTSPEDRAFGPWKLQLPWEIRYRFARNRWYMNSDEQE